jgi:hypothetical protein
MQVKQAANEAVASPDRRRSIPALLCREIAGRDCGATETVGALPYCEQYGKNLFLF